MLVLVDPQTRYAIDGCAETLVAVLKLLPRTAAERGINPLALLTQGHNACIRRNAFMFGYSSKWSERRNLQ